MDRRYFVLMINNIRIHDIPFSLFEGTKMSKIVKNSIDYFPMEAKMLSDFKFNRVRRKFGPIGVLAYISLISLIYDKHGYYAEVTEDFLEEVLFLLSGKGQPDDEELAEILKQLVHDGFFDAEIYDRYNVLTSKRIQTHFSYATKRRKHWELDLRYWLLSDEEVGEICKNQNLLRKIKEKRGKINDTLGEFVENVNISTSNVNNEAVNVNNRTTNRNRNRNIKKKEKEKVKEKLNPTDSSAAAPSYDYEKFMQKWNSEVYGMPEIKVMSEGRKKQIQERIQDVGVDEFERVIDEAIRNPFLNGENNRGWAASFKWLMAQENFLAVAEGNYSSHWNERKKSDEAGDYLDEELRKCARQKAGFDYEVVQ